MLSSGNGHVSFLAKLKRGGNPKKPKKYVQQQGRFSYYGINGTIWTISAFCFDDKSIAYIQHSYVNGWFMSWLCMCVCVFFDQMQNLVMQEYDGKQTSILRLEIKVFGYIFLFTTKHKDVQYSGIQKFIHSIFSWMNRDNCSFYIVSFFHRVYVCTVHYLPLPVADSAVRLVESGNTKL